MEDQFKKVADLIGHPVRASVLWSLMEGKAMTASEIALYAGTSQQNISNHLSKLLYGGLLVAEYKGRHRYYRFAKNEVAYAMEALSALIPTRQLTKNSFENEPAIKYCRTCYDHLAGKVSVLITESLVSQKLIRLKGLEYLLTKKGKIFFDGWDIDTDSLKKERRTFARACLDWSERKYHLAGALGAALLHEMELRDYVRRSKNSRIVILTSSGRIQLTKKLKLFL